MRLSLTALESLLVLGLAAFVTDTRLGYVFAQAGAADGVVLEIIPGHYRYENGTRVAGVIVTNEGAVVLDGLSSPEMGEDVRAKVLAATGQPVRYLVNSTFHNNYTRGNAAYTGIVSIGHELYREDLMALMEEGGVSEEERAARLPDLTYAESMTVHLGGKEIQIIHIGPAHTRGDSILYVPEDRIVYVSELIFYNRFPFYNSGYLGWINAIDQILAMDVDIFVPGQGPMTYDDPRESRDALLAIRQILVTARDAVQAQIAQGATEEEVLQNITLEQYAHLGGAFEAQSQVMLSRMYRELMGTLE
jgi:cyclase